MSILAKLNTALEQKDEASLKEILHDDYSLLCMLLVMFYQKMMLLNGR